MDNDITQHSTSSYIGARYDEVKTYRVKYVEELQAESDRRLAMLKELRFDFCPFCNGHVNWIGDEDPTSIGHRDDCRYDAECNG